MKQKPILAVIYDFDRTLSPKDMQEYAFIPGLGMSSGDFWRECDAVMERHGMDSILAYMLVMLQKAKGNMNITRSFLRSLGESVGLFEGVDTWFDRVNAYAEKRGLEPEHYIISSGLKEIIEGTAIAEKFKDIYAASFCYDENGEAFWPAMALNYTSKTQFLFKINKGVDGDNNLNEYMPESKRRVPFRNMVYIGDGMTDVPCMKLTHVNGGHSIAVYSEKTEMADKLICQDRVDFAAKADYRENGELERILQDIIDKVAAVGRIEERRLSCRTSAED